MKMAFLIALTLMVSLPPTALQSNGQSADSRWPRRVLITNDNGVDDPKMIQLARAFSKVAETYVAAPLENRSGTTHSTTGRRRFEVERRAMGEGIVAYGVDGTPAEAVVFGLQGLLRDKPPDLVISGVNGGENAGMEWLFSGTIGAARMATVLGVPGIAVSGLSRLHWESYPIVMQWVVHLAQSKIARELNPGDYLTVSIPRVRHTEIKGIDIVGRPFIVLGVQAETFVGQDPAPKREIWEFERHEYKGAVPEDSDLASYRANRIVIVPMRADENDHARVQQIRRRLSEVPSWPSATGSEKE